jgi:polyisoprenoid-binding protein YceI
MRAEWLFATLVAGVLAGCAPPVSQIAESDGRKPDTFPEPFYRQAAARGQPVFEVDPARSLVVIEVRRAGTLAQLGHDHVVASHDVHGYVAPDDSRADLYLPLDRLTVDEGALRAEAGFEGAPPEAAIAGTRDNMLARFHSAQYPYALIGVRSVATDASGGRLDVSITLNGVTRTMPVPARLDTAAGELRVTGRLEIEQTAFGIAPYSILGGALQVEDKVAIRFAIVARRVAT